MERNEARRNCWILGAIAGVIVLLFASVIGEKHWFAGLFLGVMTFALAGGLLAFLMDGQPSDDWAEAETPAQSHATPAPQEPRPSARLPLVAGTMPVTESDDLTRIHGIGPTYAGRLAEMGVTSFAQIADWTAADAAEYEHKLGRSSGRIAAEDWVAQAKVLSGGGDAVPHG